MSWSTWAGAIPQRARPLGAGRRADYSGASALVLGHCGPHLPNDSIVTDADAMSSGHTNGVQFLFGDGSVTSSATASPSRSTTPWPRGPAGRW